MATVLGIGVRIILGPLLLALNLAWWCRVWNAWFGFERDWPEFMFGWLGLSTMFLAMLSGGAGAALLTWAACDILVAIEPNLPLDYRLPFGAGGASLFVLPFLPYYRKRRRFRSVMSAMSARCGKCDYPLRGLRIVYGRIRCPECGHVNSARTVMKRFQHDKRVLEASQKEPWSLS